MNIIEFKNVHYLYSDYEEETIKGIDLCIEKGSFTVVLGRNGSGKSTLAKLTNAILIPTEGEALINGISTADESKLIDIRSEVGLVFQNPDNQIVANVVEEDVAFAPENLGVPSEEIRDRVTGSLKQVGMYELRKHAPHLLSGGQKQRIAIAGVLAMQPEIIVLDEPTSMLDPQGREDVVNAVTKLCREKGFTVLMITHHMEECIGADRLIVMSDGLIAADGTPASVFSDVEKMESLGLDVPETVRILYDLKKEGFDLPLTSLSTEECAETIIRGNLNRYA